MRKRGKYRTVAGMAALLLALTAGGCASDSGTAEGTSSSSSAEQTKTMTAGQADSSAASDSSVQGSSEQEGQVENLAMYVPYGDEGGYLMVDQESGSVFTVTMPEEIYDIDGNKIGQEDLEKGNILRIYGNGIMMNSYPGQYPGVTKIQVEETGSPSDADQYQEIIDGIYQEPDPAEVPLLSLEYRTTQAIVSAATSTGSYRWEYPAEDGTMTEEVADAPVISQWEVLNEIDFAEPTDLTLSFTETPKQVTVTRWSERVKGQAELPEGEAVEVKETENAQQYLLEKADTGYLYLVKAEWENGYTDYGFQTIKK
ncbi:MAG: hypothetical protein ACLVD1_03360 [Lacrimispora saccharolytica]